MKQRATLEKWELDVWGYDTLVVNGRVSGHPKLPDGAWIHTSRVLRIDFEAGTAETLNTFYTLKGERSNDAASR